MTKRMTVSDYSPLIEKIKTKTSNWSVHFLLFTGRWQFISSMISSITQFWCSAFRLLRSCLPEINTLCSAFLWSGPELNARKMKISWEDMCFLKLEGGVDL